MLETPHLAFVPRMTEVCKECGCSCHSCVTANSLDLHHEIEELRSKLIRSQSHVTLVERDFVESRDYAESEITKLQDELTKLRDRYERLYESHKKLQKLNHNLEDKLLTLVEKFNTEKVALESEVESLNTQLRESKILTCDLEQECEKYRDDCNIAVQLLQNDPTNFVAHRLPALPLDLQQRVKSHFTRQQLEELEEEIHQAPPSPKMIRVPMPTFPPTAMVYSIEKPMEVAHNAEPPPEKTNTVPTSLIAKVLLQPETNRKPRRIYICDKCQTDYMFMDQGTQTNYMACSDNNSFHRSLTGQRYPQSAILIQPTVHAGRTRLNSTETEI